MLYERGVTLSSAVRCNFPRDFIIYARKEIHGVERAICRTSTAAAVAAARASSKLRKPRNSRKSVEVKMLIFAKQR